MSARKSIAKRAPRSEQVGLVITVDRETLAALRQVRGAPIRNKTDLRDVLERILDEELEEIRHEYLTGRTDRPREGNPTVDGMNLPERAANALRQGMRRAGVTAVDYFAEYTVSEIQRFTKSSAKVAREIADGLERVGIKHRGARP